MALTTKYDYRFDPFTEEDQAVDVTAEGVDVPANTPYYITLEEVPRQDTPSSVVVYDVTAGATLSEVSAGPATLEYQVDYKYKTGKIRFNSAQASHHAHVTYKGTGHCIRAKWVNDVQELVGTVKMFAGLASAIQEGYLLCDGAAISRTTYADLFTKLSTRYGTGDNSTTFNLPNLVSKFVRGVADTPGTGAGADTHTHTVDIAEANLPGHTHAAGTLTGGLHTHREFK
jgi:phage-related tail fiber protein